MKSIVVGYDGSEQAEPALDRAAELGRTGASVTVVTAVGLGIHGVTGRSMGARDEDEVARQSEALDAGVAHLKAKGIDAKGVEGEGDAADVIIEAANEAKADLIIVGTRGLNAAKRALLGSVSTKVAHNAPCDVLIVR
jgi:nucleotide-binding universal stress UspA family protein